jgi:hypothetical protein
MVSKQKREEGTLREVSGAILGTSPVNQIGRRNLNLEISMNDVIKPRVLPQQYKILIWKYP